MTINIFLQVSEEFFSFEDLDKFLSWQRRFRGLPWMRTSLSGPQGGCRGDRRPPLLLSTGHHETSDLTKAQSWLQGLCTIPCTVRLGQRSRIT